MGLGELVDNMGRGEYVEHNVPDGFIVFVDLSCGCGVLVLLLFPLWSFPPRAPPPLFDVMCVFCYSMQTLILSRHGSIGTLWHFANKC